MQKILLFLIIFQASLFAEKAYEACEATKQEAKASLVTQIVSTMESGFSSETKVTQGDETKATKEAKLSINSSSRLTLSEVIFFNKGDLVCAQITQGKLIAIAKGKLKAIKFYNLDQLPTDEIALVNYLEERLDEIKQTSAIATLMADDFNDNDLKLLEEKQKLLQTERSRHHAQKISFQVTPDEATLLIDGTIQNRHHDIYLSVGEHTFTLENANYLPLNGTFTLKPRQDNSLKINMEGNKFPTVTFAVNEQATVEINHLDYPINTPITLAPGEHTYIVKSEGFCPQQNSLTAKLGTHQTISVDITTQTFPQLTINSNQEFAKLKIDAADYPLGKAMTFKECQKKTVSYAVTFDKQSRQGSVELEPGQVKTLSVDFLTDLDIRSLKTQALSYQDGSRLIFRVAYETAPSSMTVYSFDKINQKTWLRYGWGFLYGNKDTKAKVDLHYSLGLQLTDFGANEMPLHLGSFAFIPFIGIQGGGSYLESAAEPLGWLVKAQLGIDFVINRHMGFEFFTYKNFFYQQEFAVGVALSLKNPF